MGDSAELITVEQFRRDYSHDGQFEYVHGRAVKTPPPNIYHSVLQAQMVNLLNYAGYIGVMSVNIRIDPHWEPVPDVAGLLDIGDGSCITKPWAILIEILMPGEDLHWKCVEYDRLGFQYLFLLDPETRTVQRWSKKHRILQNTEQMIFENGFCMPVHVIWQKYKRSLQAVLE